MSEHALWLGTRLSPAKLNPIEVERWLMLAAILAMMAFVVLGAIRLALAC
jgi:hypothetical protein